ncbi:MAG: DUF2238 domain-containing protein [Lysobacterales bacterium]
MSLQPLQYSSVCAFVARTARRHAGYIHMFYDSWLQSPIGWSPAKAFGWQRNHYDRLVHLLYGICITLHSGGAGCANGGR